MKRWVPNILLLLLCLPAGCSLGLQAKNVPCHNDTVQESPGVVLSLSSGQTYQVFPTDNHISMTWLPMDKLIVCPIGGSGVTMTNMSERGEKVRGLRIYEWFFDQWPPG